jgi:hypothetical protein
MKLLLVFFFALISFSEQTYAQRKMTCSRATIEQLVVKVKAHSDYDKNNHCSISCLMSLRCNSSYAMMIGYLKEMSDIFTPGDFDWQDIVADKTGIEIYRTKRASNDHECFDQCDNYYHP